MLKLESVVNIGGRSTCDKLTTVNIHDQKAGKNRLISKFRISFQTEVIIIFVIIIFGDIRIP